MDDLYLFNAKLPPLFSVFSALLWRAWLDAELELLQRDIE